ncbi:MAG: dienelactone hydrolase family protein [Vulcanimicrobiota bacterium]
MHERWRHFGATPALCISDRDTDFRGVVLVYHGLFADKETQRKELETLGRRGYLAVGVDAFGHGERRDPQLREKMAGPDSKKAFLELVRATVGEVPRLVRLIRALLDKPTNFGITGISMGGYICYGALQLEPSLKAAVPILGSPQWGGDDSPHRQLDRFWPVALLAQNAGQDRNVPPDQSRQLVDQLRPRYQQDPERLAYHVYPDSDHFMREQDWRVLWERTLDWFDKYL